MLQTEISIDWLSFTSHEIEQDGLFSARMIKLLDDLSPRVEVKPFSGYKEAMRWKTGVIAMRNVDRPEMGVHFILSGEALRNMTDLGYDALFVMRRALDAGCAFTIIHLALDIYDGGYTPQQLSEDFYADRYTGRARNGSIITEKGRGATSYIGSWDSDRFIRYYDKAAEQRVTGDWKRLELVLKGTYAKAFAWEMQKEVSLVKVEEVLKGTVRAMVDMKDARWKKFMAGTGAKLAMPKHKENSTRAWILTQVARAIAKYIIQTGDEKIIDDLGAEITKNYDDLSASK